MHEHGGESLIFLEKFQISICWTSHLINATLSTVSIDPIFFFFFTKTILQAEAFVKQLIRRIRVRCQMVVRNKVIFCIF